MTKIVQFKLGKQAYRWEISPEMSLFFLFFFILFISLGCWQWQRYHDKKALLTFYQYAKVAPAVEFSQDAQPIAFQHVFTEGYYLNEFTLFIQHHSHQGKIGFEVLTPFEIVGDAKLLLVDRGWIEKPLHQELPEVIKVQGKHMIHGHIKFMDGYQFIIGKNILQSSPKPVIMQKMDIQELSQLIHHPFYPFILQLDSREAYGYVRDWEMTSVMPQRHLGYALQWFGMVFVLLIAYICFSCQRERS